MCQLLHLARQQVRKGTSGISLLTLPMSDLSSFSQLCLPNFGSRRKLGSKLSCLMPAYLRGLGDVNAKAANAWVQGARWADGRGAVLLQRGYLGLALLSQGF